jgi:heme oxygenase
MSLKELTAEKHHNAERTAFAKLLLSGNINKEQYAQYLLQMLEVYSALEYHAAVNGLFADLSGLPRVMAIYEDLEELEVPQGQLTLLESTKKYIQYLNEIGSNPECSRKLLAHLYVRHMGDLYGGQMIAKRVPGSGKFYQFRNKDELVAKIREKLDDGLGEEANVAFDHAIAIMKELNESSLEHAD